MLLFGWLVFSALSAVSSNSAGVFQQPGGSGQMGLQGGPGLTVQNLEATVFAGAPTGFSTSALES